MKKILISVLMSIVLVEVSWLWPPSCAATGSIELLQAPLMHAHFIDMGQANATLLEFPCGAVLIDAGAQDEERVEKLVQFLDEFFERRPDLNRTLKSIIITHNHIDHTRALRKVVEMEGVTVERYIDHDMTDGPGTGNPNWVRQEVAKGHRQITIRKIHESEVVAAPDHALTDGAIDPLQCPTCDPKIRLLHAWCGTSQSLRWAWQ